MTYRDNLDALRARQAALETVVSTSQRALNETRQLINEVAARARLPVLDNIRVAAPCSADWNQMSGDQRVRACGDCNKSVYNLSGMTRDDAQALIIEKEGRLCVRYFQRADGTILLKDCTVGVKQRRRRRVIAGAMAVLAASGIGATAANAKSMAAVATAEPEVEQHWTMGLVAMPDVPDGSELAEPEMPEPATADEPVHEMLGELSK
jgi:hypothetical protein